jgi:hypothetical protein
MTALLLAVRFASELALLTASAVAGARTADGAGGVLLAVLAPLAAAVLWGVFIGPKATWRLADPGRLLLEVALFLAAAGWLAVTAGPVAGVVLAVWGVSAALAVRAWAPGA